MSLPRPPVPAPRSRPNLPSSSLDEILKSSAAPASPTKSSQLYIGDSTPPPILPKTWLRQNLGQKNTSNDREEKKVDKDSDLQRPRMPNKPPGTSPQRTAETGNDPSVSYEEMTPWSDVLRDLKLKGLCEPQAIIVKAEHLYKAIQVYIKLIAEDGEKLNALILELKGIANNLDKVSKGTKIAGITGGASTVAGGVAAAAGVILAPFTAGISLALTVVGTGVAAAGGVTGASAAIANKANLTQDKKKIEKSLQEFKVDYEKILSCLKFINEGMELLKHYGLSVLKDTLDKPIMRSKIAASALHLTLTNASAIASEKSISASGLLEGFALGMEIYFTKDGQKVKKGFESKLAKNLRKLAGDFELALKELIKIKDVFSEPA